MFLLGLYNDMNDQYDPVTFSKAALDLRKRRSKGKHNYETYTNVANATTDDYARLAENIVTIRNSLGNQPSLNEMEKRFYFSIGHTIDPAHLNHATLRLFKHAADRQLQVQVGEEATLTLIVNQLLDSRMGAMPIFTKVAEMQLQPKAKGWLEFDLSETVRNWAREKNGSNTGLLIQVVDNNGNSFPFGQFGLVDNEDEHEFVPFMVCYYADQRTKLNTVNVEMARSKREAQIAQRRKASRYVVDAEEYDEPVDMGDGDVLEMHSVLGLPTEENRHATRSASRKRNRQKTRRKKPKRKRQKRKKRSGCSKERLFLNFRELGWDKYIIAPVGYAAYRCKGVCDFPLNPQLNATNHAVVQVLVSMINKKVPKPCCAPTKLEEMTMIYHDEGNRVIMRKHHDMIVSSCGCH